MNNTLSNYKIIIAPSGRRYIDKNLGSDSSTPFGKYYTFDEAKRSCPIGTRLPTWDEVEMDCKWLINNLPLGASGHGGKIGYVGYYWTGEDRNVVSGSAIYFCIDDERDLIINAMDKMQRNLVRCIVI